MLHGNRINKCQHPRRLRLGITIAIVISLFIATNASGTLIDNGTYVTDTTSGLDWLKLTQTRNRSFNNVSSELGAGGLFDGWQFATGQQFDELIGNAGGNAMVCANGLDYCGLSAANEGLNFDLINLLGDTYEIYRFGTETDGYAGYSLGLLADPSGDETGAAGNTGDYWTAMIFESATVDFTNQLSNLALLSNQGDYISTHYATRTAGQSVAFNGSWLVRQSANIPEPTTLALMAVGIVGLGFRRKTE